MDVGTPQSVVLALACVVACVVASVLVLPTLSAIARPHWKGKPLYVFATSVALVAGAPSLVVAAVAADLWITDRVDARPVVVLAALLGTVLHLAVVAHRYTPMRRLRRQLPLLAGETTRATAVRDIESLIDRTRPSAQSGAWLATWVATVLNAAEHLVNAGEIEVARRTLHRLAGLQLTGLLAQLRDALDAMIKLHLGQREAAVDAISGIARPASSPVLETLVVALDLLIRATDGRHTEALQRLRAWGHPEEWHLRTRLIARAHALAASDDEREARRTLGEIERRFGTRGVELAARVDGPASALARSLAVRDAA